MHILIRINILLRRRLLHFSLFPLGLIYIIVSAFLAEKSASTARRHNYIRSVCRNKFSYTARAWPTKKKPDVPETKLSKNTKEITSM